MPDPPRFVTVDDYEALAREVLPPAISEFVAKFDRSGLISALAETELQLGEAA